MMIIPENHLSLELTGDYEIFVRFKGQELIWTASDLRKTRFNINDFDVFKEINLFLQTQPVSLSEHLFEYYELIYDLFNKDLELNNQIVKLTTLTGKLLSVLDFDKLKAWVKTYPGIMIPSSFHSVYLDNASQTLDDFEMTDPSKELVKSNIVQAATREKTYLREDYIDLVVLTIYLRLMVPIWMVFIVNTKVQTNNDFKEYYAGQLLTTSKNVLDSPGYVKLFVYLNENIKDQGVNATRNYSLAGLSTEDYPKWVMNLILVRRISIGDVRGLSKPGQTTPHHLVTYIHSYLTQRVFKPKGFGQNIIKDKWDRMSRPGQDENKKISIFEAVSVSETHSPGYIKELEHYFSDPETIVRVLCPDLPQRLLDDALKHSAKVINNPVYEPQVKILKNIIGPYQPPNCIDNLTSKEVSMLLCLIQAMFWHRGETKLAALMTLTKIPPSDNVLIHQNRSNPTQTHIELSKKYFPHQRRVSAKTVARDVRSINIEWVNSINLDLVDSNWKHNLPVNWQLEQQHVPGARPDEYRIPNDIKVRLIELSLRIARDRYPLHKENWDKPLF